MNTSSLTAPILSAAPNRDQRRTDVPFVPHDRISKQTVLWAFTLGVGLVCPMVISIALLHLPAGPQSIEAVRLKWAHMAQHQQALFFKAVLIMPLIEEIVFRGLVLQLLRRYSPTWLAIAISSLFFGATHLGSGLGNALNATILGCVFAGLAIRTRSLFTSWLCHGAFNLCWLFFCIPAFGLLKQILATPNSPTAASINPLTGIFPWWWTAISLGLVVTAGLALRQLRPHVTA